MQHGKFFGLAFCDSVDNIKRKIEFFNILKLNRFKRAVLVFYRINIAVADKFFGVFARDKGISYNRVGHLFAG